MPPSREEAGVEGSLALTERPEGDDIPASPLDIYVCTISQYEITHQNQDEYRSVPHTSHPIVSM